VRGINSIACITTFHKNYQQIMKKKLKQKKKTEKLKLKKKVIIYNLIGPSA